MTFAPPTLKDLQALWVDAGGVSLGIVGDAPHVAGGVSYHLGRDDLVSGAYSTVLARDKAGLSYAASAIDLGPLDNRLRNLWAFSVWLVAAIRADPTKYRDVREVIYSPDGVTVLRWDNELKVVRVGGTGSGQGDDSHLWHTHISFYRDSEFRDKRALFAPYFEEVAVEAKPVFEETRLVPITLGALLYYTSGLADDARNVRLTERTPDQLLLRHVLTYRAADATGKGGIYMVAYEPVASDLNSSSLGMFVRSEDVSGPFVKPVIPPDTTPFTAADLTAKAASVLETARTRSIEAVGKAIDDVAASL